jgi:hypothetical protein
MAAASPTKQEVLIGKVSRVEYGHLLFFLLAAAAAAARARHHV